MSDQTFGNNVEVYHQLVWGDFKDSVRVWQKFLGIVNKLTGVSIITSVKHDFPGGGFSGLILIAESHAAIHTFPENGSAWMELATCGDKKAISEFQNLINISFWKLK